MSDYGLAISPTMPPSYEKDPSDVVDYVLSWHHLGTDSISASTWESDGLTLGSSSISGLVTSCFVSGGTAGEVTNLTNTITTSGGRTLQRTVYIAVREL